MAGKHIVITEEDVDRVPHAFKKTLVDGENAPTPTISGEEDE
jgi:hypothetical protein